jgi:hypothetical protein
VMRTPATLPTPQVWGSALQQRRRFKQITSFEQRLAQEAKRLREETQSLLHSVEREKAMRRVRQAETGSHTSEWLRSPGLQSPK